MLPNNDFSKVRIGANLNPGPRSSLNKVAMGAVIKLRKYASHLVNRQDLRTGLNSQKKSRTRLKWYHSSFLPAMKSASDTTLVRTPIDLLQHRKRMVPSELRRQFALPLLNRNAGLTDR